MAAKKTRDVDTVTMVKKHVKNPSGSTSGGTVVHVREELVDAMKRRGYAVKTDEVAKP